MACVLMLAVTGPKEPFGTSRLDLYFPGEEEEEAARCVVLPGAALSYFLRVCLGCCVIGKRGNRRQI